MEGNPSKFLERAHLELFRALEEEGTLSRAAERLGLTQPALTHALRKLEGLLGAPLLTRSGRRVSLTSLGERLVRSARQILPRIERAEEELKRLARGELPVVRIGVECHPCYRWLLGVVEDFLGRYPEQELEVIHRYQFGAIEALLHHQLDLIVTPDPVSLPQLVFEPVLDYTLVAVVSSRHPLADRDHLRPEDLAAESVITYPVEETRLDVFTRFLLPAGIRPRRHLREDHHEMMLVLARQGRGVAILPDWLVPPHDPCLRRLPLGAEGLAKRLYLGFRRENLSDPWLERVRQLCTEQAAGFSA